MPGLDRLFAVESIVNKARATDTPLMGTSPALQPGQIRVMVLTTGWIMQISFE